MGPLFSRTFYRMIRTDHSRCSTRGALLAEVLIALALLVMIIVMVAGLFPYSFSVDRHAWNQRTAQSLARSAIEEARGRRFDDLVNSTHSVLKKGPWEDTAGTQFAVDVRVDVEPAGTPSADAREKTVLCKVSWHSKNRDEFVTIEGKVAKMFQVKDI